ncbi:hypothetical protein [Caballeronia humi]|jgi:hypothetical protein|uniref:DUF4148 domain-containing protein n=1 Tax=Caballeronia humi TaxID=326474 RepID=A0A158FY60_9BURK|nr:hypothetical protein [Caballeronia humi]SAL24722.1 hypothetical protein AWB65_01386 [Caballeronia humi]
MKSKQLTSLLIAAAAIVATPAFASGYGPAPYYTADDGAPASQRGMSAQTVAAEQAATKAPDDASLAKAMRAGETMEAQQ